MKIALVIAGVGLSGILLIGPIIFLRIAVDRLFRSQKLTLATSAVLIAGTIPFAGLAGYFLSGIASWSRQSQNIVVYVLVGAVFVISAWTMAFRTHADPQSTDI